MTVFVSFKKYATVVILVGLGLFVACVACELILRITDTNNYDNLTNDSSSGLLTYTHNSSFTATTACYENVVITNRDGFHASEVPEAKKKGVYRIVVIGSSFVEALQVPINQGFATLLEQKLNANLYRTYTYQVIPIGMSGNGTFLDTLYYLRYGEPLKPDLVIDLTTEYEISRNAPGVLYPPQFDSQGKLIEELPRSAQNPKVVFIKNLLRRSKLAMNLLNRYTLLTTEETDFISHANPFAHPLLSTVDIGQGAPEDLWSIEAKSFNAFAARVHDDNAQFFIASWSTPNASTSTIAMLTKNLTQIASTTQSSYLNLTPYIQTESVQSGKSPVWSCDDHWDSDGHRYAADALYTYLTTHPKLIGL